MALVTGVPALEIYTEVSSHLLFPTGNMACACIDVQRCHTINPFRIRVYDICHIRSLTTKFLGETYLYSNTARSFKLISFEIQSFFCIFIPIRILTLEVLLILSTFVFKICNKNVQVEKFFKIIKILFKNNRTLLF